MRLHLFNPESDLALAAGTANFTPPKNVVAFQRALAVLPAWYANDGDNIIAPGVDAEWLKMQGLNVGLDLEGEPAPWGWNHAVEAQFRRLGCAGPFPDVNRIRELSHRRTALKLRRLLTGRLPYELPPEPAEIFSVSDLPPGEQWVFKSPWSSSGRGVVDCTTVSRQTMEKRAADSIRRQGSVLVEPRLDKIRDFAMLFESTGSGVEYRGLSLFFNSGPTAYSGNIIASEEELAAELNSPYLGATAAEVARALGEILGADYRGPLGVDMMLYGPERQICPTVEINLRTTMGFVALGLRRRWPHGVLRVTPTGAFISLPDGSNRQLTP